MCKASGKQARLAQMDAQRAADEARAKEDARAQRLDTGVKAINAQFDNGNFNDAFYDKYRNAQLDYYMPELDKQFGQAKDQLVYAHARSGTLNSSMANQNNADLVQQNDLNKANIFSKADAATGQLRQSVQAQKSALLNQLYSTENPEIAANMATNSVRTLQNQTPQLDSIGDLFKNIAVGVGGGFGTYQDAKMYNNLISSLPQGAGQNHPKA